MTTKPATNPSTSQRTYRIGRMSQHDHATTDPSTSRQRFKIKNFTAHPRITIRRERRTRRRRLHTATLECRVVDLEVGAQPC
jgi:hypothetical protein